MTPVRLIPEHASHELVEVLSGLLEAAKELSKKQAQELYTLREENKTLRSNPTLYVNGSSPRATVKATEDFKHFA